MEKRPACLPGLWRRRDRTRRRQAKSMENSGMELRGGQSLILFSLSPQICIWPAQNLHVAGHVSSTSERFAVCVRSPGEHRRTSVQMFLIYTATTVSSEFCQVNVVQWMLSSECYPVSVVQRTLSGSSTASDTHFAISRLSIGSS